MDFSYFSKTAAVLDFWSRF